MYLKRCQPGASYRVKAYIASTDSNKANADNSIVWFGDDWYGTIFDGCFPGSMEDDGGILP